MNWDWQKTNGVVPYRVLLDGDGSEQPQPHVHVHRDVHWLVRDLALQPAGPRQSEDGTRVLKRMVKKRNELTGGSHEWELIDHETRKVRVEAAGHTDDDDSDDEPALS